MTPLRPARISRAQAAFTNAVAGTAAVDLAVAGRAGRLTFEPRAKAPAAAAALALTVDGMPALLLLDSDPIATLVDLPVAAADLAALPASFQAAVVTAALDDLIQQVSSGTGLAPDAGTLLAAEQVERAPLLADREAVELGFCWRMVGKGLRTSLRGRLRLSPSLGQRIVELVAGQPPAGDGIEVDRLPLVARIQLGTTGFSVAELAGLEPQDIVLVRQHRWDQSQVAVIIAPDLRYAARVEDGEMVVLAREETGTVSEDNDDTPIADVEAVTVPIAFDLGRVELEIGELRRVAEGYVFNLQRPLDGAVTLRVNGRPIGRGELVEIEGSLGVRLTAILDQGRQGDG